MSLSSGIFPDVLKLAKVIPIYKNKEKNDITNYRPISLLSFISKVLEKTYHKRLYPFFQSTSLFCSNQFGFRKNHNTIDAVTSFTNDVINSIENKKSTLAVH
jgi:hypothetical protein